MSQLRSAVILQEAINLDCETEGIYRSLEKCFAGVHRYSATDSSTASSFDANCMFYVG